MPNTVRRAFFLAIKIVNSTNAGTHDRDTSTAPRLPVDTVTPPSKRFSETRSPRVRRYAPLHLKRYGGGGGSRTRVLFQQKYSFIRV